MDHAYLAVMARLAAHGIAEGSNHPGTLVAFAEPVKRITDDHTKPDRNWRARAFE